MYPSLPKAAVYWPKLSMAESARGLVLHQLGFCKRETTMQDITGKALSVAIETLLARSHISQLYVSQLWHCSGFCNFTRWYVWWLWQDS